MSGKQNKYSPFNALEWYSMAEEVGRAAIISDRMVAQDRTLIDVLFRVCVRFPQECKGREGEVKKIPAWRAKMLEETGRVIISPSQEEIIKAREVLKHRLPLTEGAFQRIQKMNKKKK